MKDNTLWKELVDRYFEGITTNDEEKTLKRFLATGEAVGEEFDELRAVMGYLAVGKQLKKRPAKVLRRKVVGWAAVAAVLLLLFIPLQRALTEEENICVAYVEGKRLTDSEQVMQLMKQTMQKVRAESETESVESQLNDIFDTLK